MTTSGEVADDKWWTKRVLTPEERLALTKEQKAERRLYAFQHRVEFARKNMNDARKKRMWKWLRQWFYAEAVPNIDPKMPPHEGMKLFMQDQLNAALHSYFKGRDLEGWIKTIVKAELAMLVRKGSVYNSTQSNAKNFTTYIQEIIEKEVKRQIIESMSFDIAVKGHIHKPAAGQRNVRLGDADDAET